MNRPASSTLYLKIKGRMNIIIIIIFLDRDTTHKKKLMKNNEK
jgi:hypothetical protein